MAKPKKQKLCAKCTTARDDPLFSHPTHLVHPVTGDRMLFDIRGEAVCPTCGARWRRVRNAVSLIE